MTATADPPTQKNSPAPTAPGSARERLKRGRPLRIKDVPLPEPVGRQRLREIKQNEIDEANESLARREADEKGNIVTTFDNRGHRARLLAQTLINDDGSRVYADPLGEGAEELGELAKDVFDALWDAFDELNAWSKEAKDKLGKGFAKATS